MLRKLASLTALFFVTAIAQESADCRVFAKKAVICTSDEGGAVTVSTYWMKNDESWVGKHYHPEEPGVQTEAVYVTKYRSNEFVAFCFYLGMQQLGEDASAKEIEAECESAKKDIFSDIRKGKKIELKGFEMSLDGAEDVSVMYCMEPGYVRTYRYNKDTGLETGRKDYSRLRPGTYCKDFLSNDALYWKP